MFGPVPLPAKGLSPNDLLWIRDLQPLVIQLPFSFIIYAASMYLLGANEPLYFLKKGHGYHTPEISLPPLSSSIPN